MNNNPVVQAFFFGKAFAEVASERLEETFTNALSEFGKFEAEFKEQVREFTEEVKVRAEREKNQSQESPAPRPRTIKIETETDLQETIDELRAEIARLRAELKNYRPTDS